MSIRNRIVYWLYRVQQHVAITRKEATALTVIICLIVLGAIVKSVQKNRLPFDQTVYEETDSLFAAATKALRRNAFIADSLIEMGASRDKTDSAVYRPEERALESVLLAGEKINLNLANQEELERLPRIGPTMAQRIIAYRDEKGGFRTVDEILEVKGIGPKTLERIAELITVD